MSKKIVFSCILTIILVFSIISIANATTTPVMTGSFLQPDIYMRDYSGTVTSWTSTDWNQEFGYMQAAGMDTFSIYVADFDKKTILYPNPNVSGYTQDSRCDYDIPQVALDAAAAHGIKIYFGMGYSTQWFAHELYDGGTWLTQKITEDISIMNDLYSKYGTHSAFGGLYMMEEADNVTTCTTTTLQDLFANIIKPYCDNAHSLNPSFKVIACPFVSVTAGLNASGWQSMWTRILGTANIDILAMQDGIGADDINNRTPSQVLPYVQAQYNACVARGKTSWVDVETFQATNWESMTINKIVDSMIAYAPYADKYFTFAYNHYQSPKQTNSAYQTSYLNYLNNSLTKETTAPTTPSNVAIVKVTPYDITLSWTASTDNVALLGYRIYRDGSYYTTVYQPATTFKDTGLNNNESHSYELKAIDGAGNTSAMTSGITASTTNAYPVNYALGRPYTSSIAANPTYPDSSYELTNGTYGSVSYADTAWQGRPNTGYYEFVIDLGATKTINGLTVRFLKQTSVSANLPKKVEFYASDSPTTGFTLVGQLAINDIARTKTCGNFDNTTYLYAVGGINAYHRYVKVKVTSGDMWSFIDEIEVGGNDVNLALNKPYSTTMAAQTYLDTNGTELTNGTFDPTANYASAAWQGRWSSSPFSYSFTIDLGSNCTVKKFMTEFLKNTGAGIYLPTSVQYLTSTDGINFTSRGTVNTPAVNDNSIGTYPLDLASSVSVRYIKITVNAPGAVWSFIDEAQVIENASIAICKTYTATLAASSPYMDTANKELTDGVAATTSYIDNAWQGRNNSASYSFTVDLGSSASVRKFASGFLKNTTCGIYIPNSVQYLTSSDNITFTSRGTVNAPSIGDISIGTYILELGSAVNARYIKIVVNTPGGWSFIDEFKIGK